MVDLLACGVEQKEESVDLVKREDSSFFISAGFFTFVNGEMWIVFSSRNNLSSIVKTMFHE